jgi:hypothetical protein
MEVDGLVLVQIDSFEFDEVFRDYSLSNPLVKQHEEFDEVAMLEHHLTPDRYNRCALVWSSLACKAMHTFPIDKESCLGSCNARRSFDLLVFPV